MAQNAPEPAPNLEPILAKLRSEDRVERIAAINQLVELGDVSLLPFLIEAIDRDRPGLPNKAAIQALTRLGEPAVPQLLAQLYNEKGVMRPHVLRALKNIGGESVQQGLMQLLFSDKTTSPWGELSEALAHVGQQAIVPQLVSLLEQSAERSTAYDLALKTLIHIGGWEVVTALMRIMERATSPGRSRILFALKGADLYPPELHERLRQRAVEFHRIMLEADYYLELLSDEEFEVKAAALLEQYVRKATDRSYGLRSALNRLPYDLPTSVADKLPKNIEAIHARLEQRARNAHRAFQEAGVYRIRLVSEAEFLERTKTTIEDTARRIADGTAGMLDLVVFNLPANLLNDLQEAIPQFSYDFEFGYEAFFKDLADFFSHYPFEFSWSYDSAKQEIAFRLDRKRWLVPGVKLNAELDTPLYNKLEEMTIYLRQRGWYWLDINTGDQVGLNILIPLANANVLHPYLRGGLDDRYRITYGYG